MARICIVTASALGSNPRVVKEANALAEEGYDVKVISMRIHPGVEPRDKDALSLVSWQSERVDLRTRAARVPYRLIQLLNQGGFALTESRAFAQHAHSAYTLPLLQRTIQSPADLYIAHYPAALPAAAIAAGRNKAVFAYDAEDFHLGDLPPTEQTGLRNRIIRTIEKTWLCKASYISAASPGIASAYAREYSIEAPTVILNVFPVSEAPPGPVLPGDTYSRPSIYWVSQMIGPDRGLECAVKAISLTTAKPHLYLQGSISSGYRAALFRLARQYGVDNRLHILDLILPSDLVRTAAHFDIGLASETGSTKNHQLALSNKQFTYLLAGIPSLLSSIPAHQDLLKDIEGAGFVYSVDDAASLAHHIDQLVSNPEALHAARLRAFELGQTRFNFDLESSNLLRVVERSLCATS